VSFKTPWKDASMDTSNRPDQTPWDRQDYFEHTKERGTTEKAPSWSWSSRRSRHCDLSDLSVLRQILRPGGYLRS
jgi:hypothetical protein